jgi:hypothetical protein
LSRRNFQLLPYLPVIILPIILFAGPIFRLEALYWGTPGLQFIPWRAFVWESISNGSFPLWNPYNGMGAPLAANYQSALFYPPGWILYLFAAVGETPWLAWAHTLLVVLHLIWAGTGMIRLVRWLGLGELSQAVGAISFALGSYLVARAGFFSMVWTAAWLPWIIMGASQIASPVNVQSSSNKGTLKLSLIVSIAMMLLAGHAQLSWYILLLTAAWIFTGGFILAGVTGGLKSILKFGAAVGLAVLLASIQLLPTAEYLFQSQRSGAVDFDTALSYSYWPWRFLTIIAPDLFGNPGHGNYWGYANYWEDALYIGVLPVLLALATFSLIGIGRKRNLTPLSTLVKFCWAMIGIGFLLALGKNTPIFPFLYQYIPTFDMFNAPSRFLIWPLFGLALLASIGIDHWRTPTGRGLYWLRLATAGGFAVTLGAFLTWYFLREVSPTFIRATSLAGFWGLGAGLLTLFIPDRQNLGRRVAWQWFVVLWVAADLVVAGWNINPTIDMAFYKSNPVAVNVDFQGKRVYLSSVDDYYLKFRRFLRFEDFRPLEDPINMRQVSLPNLNLFDGISSANNFDPMVPARYARWMQELASISSEERKNWLAMMNVGYEERIDMQSATGVRFDPVEGGEKVRFYECAAYVRGEEKAFQQVSQNLLENRVDTLVLEGFGSAANMPCQSFCVPFYGKRHFRATWMVHSADRCKETRVDISVRSMVPRLGSGSQWKNRRGLTGKLSFQSN